MNQYVVVVQDVVTKELNSIVCKDSNDLATLISNLNTTRYTIDSVKKIANVITELDHFCIKNDNLETGV